MQNFVPDFIVNSSIIGGEIALPRISRNVHNPMHLEIYSIKKNYIETGVDYIYVRFRSDLDSTSLFAHGFQ